MINIEKIQKECCSYYEADCLIPSGDQLVVISYGVYEGGTPIEGVRYPSPSHMSGWWLTTDQYDGDTSELQTVHFSHILERRPDIAAYLGLPFGYRFQLGGEDDCVWFDESVAEEKI